MQNYEKKTEYKRKITFFAFFFEIIWSYQKKAVPLHPLSKRKCAGCSSARLECLLWEQEVVSSNLAIPTNQTKPLEFLKWFFLFITFPYTILLNTTQFYSTLLNSQLLSPLHLDQSAIVAIQRQQLIMCTLLYDLSLMQYADHICITNRTQAVCHYDGGTIFHQVL